MTNSVASREDSLFVLRDELRRFAAARDWDQFHSPKNLAIALSIEAAELLETFQWMTEADSRNLEADSASLAPEQKAEISKELADVLLYLIRLADKLNVDLAAAAAAKIEINAAKYPIEKARGSSKKHSDY
jgi:dCTP diphosphatase